MRLRRFASILSIIVVLASLAVLLPAAPALALASVNVAILPITGPVGTIVTITGSGFTASATFTVKIDGAGIISGTITPNPGGGAIPAAFTFTVPALPVGGHSVTVTTNVLDTSNTVTFTVTPSITPGVVTGQVGNTVSLIGNGFSAGATATTYWDTTTISTTTTTAAGSFLISFSVPQATNGPHTLTTTDTFGYSATFGFTVAPSTTLNSSTVTVGSQMTISGAGYAGNSTISIYINSSVVATTRTNLTGSFSYNLAVPALVRGSYSLAIFDGSGNTASTGFVVNSAATVTPASFTSGNTVAVSGTGFAPSSVISTLIDGNVINASAATTDSLGGFSLTGFTIPKLPGGSHSLQLKDAIGNTVTVNFNITQAITVTPQSGQPGTNVQVTGSGFSATAPVTIYFDGPKVTSAPAAPVTDASGGFSASFVVPPSAGGNHQILASDGTFSAAAGFGVTSSANINPVSGTVGTTVAVSGTSFASKGTISITFDSTPVATITADTAGSFNTTFAVPQSATGTRPVVVSDGTRSVTFSFAMVPSITVTPATGYVGTAITVKGSGFAGNGQISTKYDAAQITTASANAVGSFAVVFNAPVSKGGNHSIVVSDTANTVTATFSMDATPPPVPGLVLPLDGTKADALAEFQWVIVTDPNGVSYQFQISRDRNFSVVLLEKKELTSPGYTLRVQEKLRPASKSKPYYWRVRAIDASSNESAWSPVQSFYVGFVLPGWAMYAIFAVVVVIAFAAGLWLGGRRHPARPAEPASRPEIGNAG